MTSIFLERNLSELPKPGKRRLSTDSHKTDPPGINETFIVKLSPIKTNLENDKQVPKKEDKGLYQKKVSKKGDFKEVRRKLAFTDETEDRKYGKMDFTDKMAAFRTLLKRETPKDPVCNSEKGFKTNGSNSTVGKVSDYLELQNGNIKSINDLRGCLPRTKEARTILSSLADDELSKMSLLNLEAQLYLERHKGKESHQDTINRFSDKLEQFVSSTKSKSDAATDRNSNAKDDYLDKFLKMGSEQNRISNKKEKNRKVSKKYAESHAPHDSDSDLDKIPQRESDSQKAHSCDIDLKCQKHKPGSHALSEAGSSVVDGPGSVRRAANRSIQSNVPHYHPSYPAQRDTPVELLQSSKGKNEEGLCRGIRTGEVIITKTNTGGSKQKTEDLQSNLKGKQRKHSEKGYLTLQDLAERDRKRRQSPEKRSTERQIRKNIMELKKDLEISDSSKENSPLLHRKVHHKLTQYEDDPDDVLHIEELTSGPGVEEGVISGSKAKVFGPRHPESDSRRGRRGQSSDVASRVSSQTGSLRSVGSNSSTVMAVELLRKLYHVDPRTRQDLILKAKCFRRWLQNVQTMQSIDENGLDDFADPLSQTVKEAYVQDSSRQARSHTGSGVARLFESDSVACNNLVHSRQDMHQGFFERRINEPVFQVDSKEKVMSKVAPITIENLEKHERCQSNIPNHSNLAAFVNETSKAAFARNDDMNRRGFAQTDTLRSGSIQNSQNLPGLGTGVKVGHSVKRTVKTRSHASSPSWGISGVSQSVIEKARIARGLGRATNIVHPAITENMQLLDTANYGVCLQSAEIFYRKRLLSTYFQQWKCHAAEQALIKMADTLHRHHTLKKGIEAFKWAINRSKIFVDIFQNKMRGMTLSSTFFKWHERTLENRYLRLHNCFTRWKHFTAEAQKVRNVRESSERKLLNRSFLYWVDVLRIRLKENAADKHFRCHLLTYTLTAWRIYSLESKEKQRRNELARNLYCDRLQKKMFREMVMVHRKMTQAKQYHKSCHLRQVFVCWHQAACICKTERERDFERSKQHWEHTTITKYFIHWHETVLIEKARQAASQNLIRNAFCIWQIKWEYNVQYREKVAAQVRHEILQSSIACWKNNVDILRRRREAAVVFIQRVLVRHTLHDWNNYTKKKKKLGGILTTYTKQRNFKIQQTFMSLWKSLFQERLDIQRAKAFWSNTCVRKSVLRWKSLCHKRSLKRLLQTSEPSRQQRLLKAMFQRWVDAKNTIECEKVEASESRTVLQKSQLRRYFQIWTSEAELRIRIRPMIQKKMNIFRFQSFTAWHELVKRKQTCRSNEDIFRKTKLRALFNDWRHQFLLHQLEKDLHPKILRNHLKRCVTGWRSVIERKRKAGAFHSRQLLQQTFLYWKTQAVTQLRQKVAAKEIQDWNSYLVKVHFNLWWENAQYQKNERETLIQNAEERRKTNQIAASFHAWRTLFRATLVARENQKILTQRLLQRAIQAWHTYTQRSLRKSVYEFALRLGLEPPDEGSFSNLNSTLESGSEDLESLHMLNDTVDLEVTSGNQSPHVSSAAGTPRFRLFSPALSRVSLDLDRSIPEIDCKPSMSNTNFIDARFEMEQAVKTQRLKEIVSLFMKRLRFWPISSVFDQWREYTVRHKELRHTSQQLVSRVQELELIRFFMEWKVNYSYDSKARLFRSNSLKRQALQGLYNHSQKMRYKKQLSALAHNYHSLNVFRKVFPMWHEKAQDKRHKEKVVYLWTTVTEEEKLLIPMETQIKEKIHRQTLHKCFSLWQLKFLQIYKMKIAYHRVLLKRCFESWHVYAAVRHEEKRRSQTFNTKRLLSEVFKLWRTRHAQQIMVKEKFDSAKQRNQKQIFTAWHTWTIESRQRKVASNKLCLLTQHHLLVKSFTMWRQERFKLQQVRKWCDERLIIRVLYEWHQVTVKQKMIKQKVLRFKVTSYTKLVIRMFKIWHNTYLERLKLQEEHEETIRRLALQLGKLWKRKTQKRRSMKVHQIFMQRKVKACFGKWKYSYERNMERENQLRKYVIRKNRNLTGNYLDSWKMALLSKQAGRHFDCKMLRTVFIEWILFAKASKERKLLCRVYLKAAEQKNLKSYFHYWRSLSKVQSDIRNHCDLKLQIRVLREWHIYAKRRAQLRVLGELMTQHVNLRIQSNVWYTMRQQYDYHQSLSDTANKIIIEKNYQCMKLALCRWRDHLNLVIAGQYYNHLLATRVARQWHRFVAAQKAERKREQELNDLAVRHYNNNLCTLVFRALHNEVKVKHQILRRKERLCNKYGRLWKLRVDMMYTAICVENENLVLNAWHRWKVASAKIQAANKVVAYNNRKILTQVFIAWKGISFKKSRQDYGKSVSCIPLPVLPQPYSSDLTPRQSQIPAPMNGNMGRYGRNAKRN